MGSQQTSWVAPQGLNASIRSRSDCAWRFSTPQSTHVCCARQPSRPECFLEPVMGLCSSPCPAFRLRDITVADQDHAAASSIGYLSTCIFGGLHGAKDQLRPVQAVALTVEQPAALRPALRELCSRDQLCCSTKVGPHGALAIWRHHA